MSFGSTSFHQRAGDVGGSRIIAFLGQVLSETFNTRRLTLINSNPQAAQVTTMAVSGSFSAGTERTFTITVGGTVTSISYTSVAGDTDLSGVAASIVTLVNATEAVRGFLTASSSTTTITFTGNYPGIAFTVAESDSNLGTPSTTTAAAEADAVSFGRAMVSQGMVTNEGVRAGFVATTASFTAQVISLTFAGNTASYYTGSVTVNGKTYPWGGVVWTTDLDTTCTAIAAAINAVLPANTVIAASVGSSGGVVTLTAEVAGVEFDAEAYAVGHADAEATKAYTTGPSISTSFVRAFAGVSERSVEVENVTRGGDDPAWPANAGVLAVAGGRIAVSNAQDPSHGDDVYVSLASATKGLFYNAAGTDRVWLPPEVARWDRNEPTTQSQDIAILALNNGRIY